MWLNGSLQRVSTMSLWDQTVGQALQSATRTASRNTLGRFALNCAERAIRSCTTPAAVSLTADQLLFLHNLAQTLHECEHGDLDLIQSITQSLLPEIETRVNDPDREDSVEQCWYCSLEAALYAILVFHESDWMTHAATSVDASYRCVTDRHVQAEIARRGQSAIDEEELIEIERSLPVCNDELRFQADLLNSLLAR